MKKLTLMAMTLAVLFSAADAQVNKTADPNSWKRAWTDYSGVKYQLDGCYRSADQLAVCTFTVSSPEDREIRWYWRFQTVTDAVGRKLTPSWGAFGASGVRMRPGDGNMGEYVAGSPTVSAGLPAKLTLAFPLSPQYSSIAQLDFADNKLLNVPVTVPGAAKAFPTTGTAGNYNVSLVNCILGADNKTLSCNATLTPK